MSNGPYYGGGGFLDSPGSASGSPGGAARRSATHSLRPVTILQMQNATQSHAEADWQIDNMEIGQLTVVARVTSVTQQTTNRQYWIEDGTGRTEARHWTDQTAEPNDDVEIAQGDAVRVIGTIKAYGGRKYINASHIHKVTDFHEVLFHALEACSVTLTLERGPPLRPGEQRAESTKANSTNASAYTAQSGSAVNSDQFAHLPKIQRQIVEFIMEQPKHDDGVHVAAIARAVGGDATKISDALDRLMDDGQVYTTIDESHFNVST